MFIRLFLLIFAAYSLLNCELPACTGLLVEAKDHTIVSGRTVEFGIDLDMHVAVIPRGMQFVGQTPKGNGISYTSKYAAAGIYCFDQTIIMDGINEKGLVAAAFYFSNYAQYADINAQNQNQALSPVDFTNWILTQFATIDEVKEGIESIAIAPTVLKNWGPTPPPFHYIVYDKSGKSIVIEPRGGTLKVYENKIGTITNSPTFDWQLTNLSNYMNLSPYNVHPLDLRGFLTTSFGQGSGMLGLPGDFTPPSRFVRAALFSTSELPAKNSQESVYQTFHILNQFDIPYGSVRDKQRSGTSYDFTQLTSVKDPQKLCYYYRSYEDQTIRYIDLNQFDLNSKTIKKRLVGGDQRGVDVSSLLR